MLSKFYGLTYMFSWNSEIFIFFARKYVFKWEWDRKGGLKLGNTVNQKLRKFFITRKIILKLV